MFPTLAESMRVADNRFKFNQLTGRFNTNWLGAEGMAQSMQPPPMEAPSDPGQARLNATTVNPLTGRREWKPAKFGGPLPGLSPSPGLPVSPSSGDAPQWDAQPVGFGGPPAPARNPRGSGADPFDPRSKFGGGQYFAEGGPTTLPMPKPDTITAKVGADEFMFNRPDVMVHGLDKLLKMQNHTKEVLAELRMEMPDSPSLQVSPSPSLPPDMPGFAEGGLVYLTQAMADQDAAAQYNYNDPMKQANRAVGQFFFPQKGVDLSNRAHESTQTALGEAGAVFDSQAAIDAGFDAQRDKRKQMLASLGNLSPVEYGPAPAMPNPYSGPARVPTDPSVSFDPPPVWPSIPQFQKPTGLEMPPMLPPPSAAAAAPFMADPQALADYRSRMAGHRAAPSALSPQPSAFNTPGQLNDGHFLAPWEKDAAARQARQQELIPGMNRTQSRRFAATPQGAAALMGRQERAQDRAREDQRNTVKDQQEAEDRRLRMAEFQQRGDYYKRQAAAGDRNAELQVKQYELDVLRNEQEEKRRNTPPELKAVPTPDGRGVVYYSGNQLASGVMPTGNDAAVLTREQMDALDVDVDRVVDGKISYKKRGGGNPVLRDVTQPGQIAPTTYQFNPQTRQWEPPAIAGAAPAAPAAQSPRARNAPPPAAHITALKANPQAAADFDAKYGAGAAAKILGTK